MLKKLSGTEVKRFVKFALCFSSVCIRDTDFYLYVVRTHKIYFLSQDWLPVHMIVFLT